MTKSDLHAVDWLIEIFKWLETLQATESIYF